MESISEELVDETWQEFAGFSSVRLQKETVKVNKNQPNLLSFILEYTQDLEQDVKELGIYMFYVICRMFQKSAKKSLKRISSEEIIDCYEKTSLFFENLEGTDERFLERIAEVQLSDQPYVMRYVIEALMEALEEDETLALTEEDVGYLFLVLKTVVDLLNEKLSKGSKASPGK